jgi:uncharacterized protein (DUF1800 family)
LPLTGQFVYVENWHDGYQKRVLATEFDAFARPLSDGRQVLDLVAAHPATARLLCDKLCRRFIGEEVPARLRQRLMEVWLENTESHDQIARVLRALLLSHEFLEHRAATPGVAPPSAKTRRPLALAAAFARAMQIDLNYSEQLAGEIAAAGQNLFGWPAPTGLPDAAAPFLSSQAMRHRWSLVLGLAENNWNTGAIADPNALGVAQPTTQSATIALLNNLIGAAPAATVAAIVTGCGWPAGQPLNAAGAGDAAHRWSRLAAYCAMAPDFQVT